MKILRNRLFELSTVCCLMTFLSTLSGCAARATSDQLPSRQSRAVEGMWESVLTSPDVQTKVTLNGTIDTRYGHLVARDVLGIELWELSWQGDHWKLWLPDASTLVTGEETLPLLASHALAPLFPQELGAFLIGTLTLPRGSDTLDWSIEADEENMNGITLVRIDSFTRDRAWVGPDGRPKAWSSWDGETRRFDALFADTRSDHLRAVVVGTDGWRLDLSTTATIPSRRAFVPGLSLGQVDDMRVLRRRPRSAVSHSPEPAADTLEIEPGQGDVDFEDKATDVPADDPTPPQGATGEIDLDASGFQTP